MQGLLGMNLQKLSSDRLNGSDLPLSSSSRCQKESKRLTPAQQQSDKAASVSPGVGRVLYQIRLFLSDSFKTKHSS